MAKTSLPKTITLFGKRLRASKSSPGDGYVWLWESQDEPIWLRVRSYRKGRYIATEVVFRGRVIGSGLAANHTMARAQALGDAKKWAYFAAPLLRSWKVRGPV